MNFDKIPNAIARHKAKLAILIIPFGLSACVVDEVLEEQINVVFEQGGAIKYDHTAIATINPEDLNAPDLEQMLDEVRLILDGEAEKSFTQGHMETGLERKGSNELSISFSGRIMPEPFMNDSGPDGVVFVRAGNNAWDVRIEPNRNHSHDRIICISIEEHWEIVHQYGNFPDLSVGGTTCGNWTELQAGHPGDEIRIARMAGDGIQQLAQREVKELEVLNLGGGN